MTVVETVRAKLTADAALTALVGSRIYPQFLPQDPTLPAIVLSVISDVPVQPSFTGSHATTLREARLQVDAYATKYLDAHQVADAVDAAIADVATPDLSIQRDIREDLYENETQLHRVSTDYMVML